MIKSLFVATILAAPLAAQSKPAPDSLLDHLVGDWVLTGTIGGKETTHDVSFAWVLNREYVEMHEVSREKTATGASAYEAIVYLVRDTKTGGYSVLWLDNTAPSNFRPLGVAPAGAVGDSIPFTFAISPTDTFHTTFLYDRAHDTWAWHMDDVEKGVATPFARVTLRRR